MTNDHGFGLRGVYFEAKSGELVGEEFEGALERGLVGCKYPDVICIGEPADGGPSLVG